MPCIRCLSVRGCNAKSAESTLNCQIPANKELAHSKSAALWNKHYEHMHIMLIIINEG